MTIKLAICGAAGRMGKRLLALADADQDFELVQAIEWSGFNQLGEKINQRAVYASRAADLVWTAELAAGADIVVDFSSPAGVAANVKAAVATKTKMVVGTTGLDQTQVEELKKAGDKVAVMFAPNYSLGVNLLFRLAAEAARMLGDDYNIEIVEIHHNQKVDAPSGTALGISRAVAEALHRDHDSSLVYGRHGKPGKRTAKEIGMHALRMGSVTGEHTVYFANDVERLEISHRAESRDIFAAGALKAAKWLMTKETGFYDMQDMLFGNKQ